MKQELDDFLCAKYPKIFAQRKWDMSQTCMCWGFTCGDGWFTIIDQLCRLIQCHIDWTEQDALYTRERNHVITELQNGNDEPFLQYMSDHTNSADYIKTIRRTMMEEKPRPVRDPCVQVQAVQVKEKLGGLRFYIEHETGDDYVRGAIALAEDLSFKTCEVCGNIGQRRGGRGIRTLCDEHYAEQQGIKNNESNE